MSHYRLVLTLCGSCATLVALGASTFAAEALEQSTCITFKGQTERVLELQPGMTKIVKVCQPVQVVVIGNPKIANATAINLGAIAISGKRTGSTNLILFDEDGKEMSNRRIQVVQGSEYEPGNNVRERHEIRIIGLGGATKDRRYLCAQNCSAIQVDEPAEMNPPTDSPSSVASKTETIIGAPAPSSQGTAAK